MKGTIAEEAKYLISITVKEWVKIFKETGELSPMRGKQPTKIDLSQLRKQENPSWFQHAQTFGVTQSAISKALAKLGITRKKKPPL